MFDQVGFVHHINNLRTICDHIKYVDGCTIGESCSQSGIDGLLQTFLYLVRIPVATVYEYCLVIYFIDLFYIVCGCVCAGTYENN